MFIIKIKFRNIAHFQSIILFVLIYWCLLMTVFAVENNELTKNKTKDNHSKRRAMLESKGYWIAKTLKIQYKDTESRRNRIRWWRNARFGIFVHWGVYSVLGGEYNGKDYGKEISGPSAEWIFKTAKIPKEEYRKIAKLWNPQCYNPEDWCKLAKDAGAEYIVLTAKHHDGFALFDDKGASNWNSINSTNFKYDLLKKFVDAARQYNLKVGIYYSHRLDWWHIGLNKNTEYSDSYIKLLRSHLTTIMKNYKPDLMWFDMGRSDITADIALEITRKYNPNCVICGRIGGGYGDYTCLKDRQLPPPGNIIDCETPMTMRLNWGFDKNDKNWKSSDLIIKNLSLCSTRNTNFLLNVGPQPDGRLTDEEIMRLKKIAKWMKNNSEAIKNTKVIPFINKYSWGALNVALDDKSVYMHIYEMPPNGKLVISNIDGDFTSVEYLSTHQSLKYSYNAEKKIITIEVKPKQKGTVDIIKLISRKAIVFDQ